MGLGGCAGGTGGAAHQMMGHGVSSLKQDRSLESNTSLASTTSGAAGAAHHGHVRPPHHRQLHIQLLGSLPPQGLAHTAPHRLPPLGSITAPCSPPRARHGLPCSESSSPPQPCPLASSAVPAPFLSKSVVASQLSSHLPTTPKPPRSVLHLRHARVAPAHQSLTPCLAPASAPIPFFPS